jgi:catechol 2,3-dioxygenase-like lactoylglutathione lyase family enzyme
VQKQIETSGDYGIGLMIHAVHMTDDVAALNKFYEDVFGGLVYMGVDEPNYLDSEDRWAGLIMVSDLCIETMAPAMPVNKTKPVGKFYAKYGQHLHSVGYKVDELSALGDHMIDAGIYIGRPGGGRISKMDSDVGYFYPSPRDTAGLMVELCAVDMPNDPRLLDTWTSQRKFWELSHPLGIKRMLYVTLGCRDLESAVKTYVDTMQAIPVTEGIDDGQHMKYATLRLGDCLLQLAEPLDQESLLGQHVAKWSNMIYAFTFRVNDLDAAEAWLNLKGIKTSRPRDGLLAADPADTFSAPFFFTTDVIEGDPFEA